MQHRLEEVLATAGRAGSADVLITNVLLRGAVADGYALAAQLHADRPELPVFILTAYRRADEHVERAHAAPARAGFSEQERRPRRRSSPAFRPVAAGGTWFGDEPG